MNRHPPSFTSRQLTLLAFAVIVLLLAGSMSLWLATRNDWQQYQVAYAQATGQEIQPTQRIITPALTGKPELCTTCHIGLEEISASHPLDTFGCVLCHGGDGLALDQSRAHSSLRGGPNPSDFSVVQQSCGQSNCHSGYADPEQNHIDRVLNSLQATYASGIALVRHTFGAQPDLTGHYGAIAAYDPHPIADFVAQLDPMPVSSAEDLTQTWAAASIPISGHPIDSQFRQSCLSGGCHLSAPATAEPYRVRSTGCAACHYLYDNDGLYKGNDPTLAKDEVGHGRLHQLTTAIPFTQCNHCHNRGNYSLRTMRFTPRPDLPPVADPLSEFMSPQERRLREYYQPIGQFTECEWKLDCVDCHTSEAAMGNGHIADAMAEAQGTECRTCHGTLTSLPQTQPISDPNEAAMRQSRLNGHGTLQVGDRVVVNQLGEKLWAVKQVGPSQFMETLKISGESVAVPLVMGSACQQKPDEQASHYCHACHAYPREDILQGDVLQGKAQP